MKTFIILFLCSLTAAAQTFTISSGKWKSTSTDTSLKISCAGCALSGTTATLNTGSVWLKWAKPWSLAGGFQMDLVCTLPPNKAGYIIIKDGTISLRLDGDSTYLLDYLSFPSLPVPTTSPEQLTYYSGVQSTANGEITLPIGKSVKITFAYDPVTGRYAMYVNGVLDQVRYWQSPNVEINNKPGSQWEFFRALTGTRITSISFKQGRPAILPKGYRVLVKPDSVILDRNDVGQLDGYVVVRGLLEGRKSYPFSGSKPRIAVYAPGSGTVRVVVKGVESGVWVR